MQRLSQDELQAAKRIYNRVNDLTNNYYGKKIAASVKDFVSSNRWIMFPVNNVTSLREGASHPVPNVFISFEDIIVDNQCGQVNGWVGLTYNNSESMLWLHESLRPKKAEHFLKILSGLTSDWIVEISQKIKTNFQDNTPKYHQAVKPINASSATAEAIKTAIKNSDVQLPKRGDDYDSEPVLNAITMVSVLKETTVQTFDSDIKNVFELFFKVLGYNNDIKQVPK